MKRVAPNVLEEFNNSMLRKIADLIKQMEVQRILTTDFMMYAYQDIVVF